MSLRRRLYDVAKAEASHAASRLRAAAGELLELRKPRRPDAFDEQAEYVRLRREVEAQIDAELRGGSPRSRSSSRPGGKAEQIRRFYANLELPMGAPIDEVRAAYRKLMRRYHPDKHHDDPARARAAHQLSHQLREAYEGLLHHLQT